ncbi:amylo-alpha-1,6-glucosidase [Catenulispora rubra]|uniref:amylo-alpha-1,6-glucosidase n=1 Tax=Catenulispora rubra TaxID=280293 RepID=UPI00189247F7|nr:trehalase family glycosidase [Catenulispora rubra]
MTIAGALPTFDVRDIPFSHHGSWFGISPVIAEATYAEDLHLVSHQNGLHAVLRFTPTDPSGSRVEAAVEATPARLGWTWQGSAIELGYETDDTVRVRGDGTGLGLRVSAADPKLTPFSGPYFYRDPVDGSYIYTLYQTGRRYRITVLSGEPAEVFGEQALGTAERGLLLPADRAWEIAVEEFDSARPRYRRGVAFDGVVKAAEKRFAEFVDAIAPWRGAETPAAELAAYVLWSATVRPAGFLSRPGVLMSKHWMDKVWSWDHCFNAIALAAGAPELAWSQFQIPFDHQDESGALPDSVTHSEVLYNYVKPPIHGWALGHLRANLPRELSRAEVVDVYDKLSAWTRFWLSARRVPGQALPHYQHGNDSGWDNATTFDADRVVQTSDLAAFLILQLDRLAGLAEELDLPDDADVWRRHREEVSTAMLKELWRDGRFVARGAATGKATASTSLLDLMAIVLGDALPGDVRDTLARDIEAHLTQYGPATEQLSSEHYEADGYWRGPIWAPSTVLIEDGLRRAGFAELADEVSSRFRALCEKSGFAENFDALSGTGLRDRAYTWTASAYLILAAAHESRRQG